MSEPENRPSWRELILRTALDTLTEHLTAGALEELRESAARYVEQHPECAAHKHPLGITEPGWVKVVMDWLSWEPATPEKMVSREQFAYALCMLYRVGFDPVGDPRSVKELFGEHLRLYSLGALERHLEAVQSADERMEGDSHERPVTR